VQSNQNDLKNL